jgi:hypothetical protein
MPRIASTRCDDGLDVDFLLRVPFRIVVFIERGGMLPTGGCAVK